MPGVHVNDPADLQDVANMARDYIASLPAERFPSADDNSCGANPGRLRTGGVTITASASRGFRLL